MGGKKKLILTQTHKIYSVATLLDTSSYYYKRIPHHQVGSEMILQCATDLVIPLVDILLALTKLTIELSH